MSKLPSLREMIQRLVALPSVSSVMPALDMGNRAVIDTLAEWLESLSFHITIQPLAQPDKANLIATLCDPNDMDGLVLAGNTDTVPYDEGRWQHDPFTLTQDNGRLYGLGTADMKTFLALAVEAARTVSPQRLRRPLVLLATADEESGMQGAITLGATTPRPGRFAVIGEPTGLQPVRQHKSILMEAIRLRGQSGHSSDPRLGNSALEGMHAVIGALLMFRQELGRQHHDPAFSMPTPTLNLGHIHGGDNPNRICGECELHLDLRALPGMDLDGLRGTLREQVERIAQARGLDCEFRVLFEGVPAMATPADSKIVRLAEALTGSPAQAVAFATEGPYLNAMGMETVILGPGDIAQAHQPDEFIALERLDAMLDLLRALIQKVCVD